MGKRDLAWRLGGIVPLAMSVGTSLVHRSVLAAARHGPATAAEFILGMLSFTLASLGVLLLIYGSRLRDDWRRDLSRLDADASGDQARPSASLARGAPLRTDDLCAAAYINYYLPIKDDVPSCPVASNPPRSRPDRSF